MIDRIIDDIVICECINSGEVIQIPKKQLPKGVREGHVLRQEGDGFVMDQKITQQRQTDLDKRLNRLFEKSKG